MKHSCRGICLVGALAVAAHSQLIDLKGVVRDRAGVSIAGVVVTQVGTGLKDTTDTQGKFQIYRASTGVLRSRIVGASLYPVFVAGEGIRFEHALGGTVALHLFDVGGRSVRFVRTTLGAGQWTLPTGDLPMGTYFGRLEAEGIAKTFRFTTLQSATGNRRPSGIGASIAEPAFRQTAAMVAVDSLRATKIGYTDASIPVSSLTDSALVVVMETTAMSSGSEGCGKTATRPDPATKQTLSVSGTNRTYLLFLPTNYDKSKEYPVVFAFHGGGGNGAAARNDFKLEAAANNGAILVYPDGGWNYGTGTDVAFFDVILKDMKTKYCLNTKRVFVTGFSLGGIFSNGLGCLRGGTTVRGIVPVAGSGPNPNMAPAQSAIACPVGTPPSDVPTMVIHGTADANALYKYGQWAAEFWRKWNGATTTTTTPPSPFAGCVDYQGGRVPVRFCTHSGGHIVPSWAGQYVWAFAQSLL